MGELSGHRINLDIAPGFYADETDLGAMGRWKDGDLVRWKNNLVQSLGGWKAQTPTGDVPILGVPRSIHDWISLDGTDYVAIGTEKRLYVMTSDFVVSNITPVRATGALTDPFFTSDAGAYDPASAGDASFVKVNDATHGCTVGDIVTFDSFTSPVGGIAVNGDFEVISVTDTNNYVIQGANDATSTVAGGGGGGNFTYEITVGSGASGIASGWGTGSWGEEAWGTPRTMSSFVQELRTWSLDNWGEDLIASPRGGQIYLWDKSVGVGTVASVISQSPATNLRVIVSPENRQLIALGAHTGSVSDPLFIAWCDNEDFTEWTAASDNAAGDKRIDQGSKIVTGLRSRYGILIWTDKSLHVMQPTTGDAVYTVRGVGSGIAIAGPSAAADANGIVYFMGATNFYVYDGSLRVLRCPVWTHVYDDFNKSQSFSTFCSHSKDFNEVWWFYPSSGKAVNDKYVVYNYLEDIWYFGSMERASFHDYSPFLDLPFGFDNDGVFYTHEDGENANDEAMSSYVESGDISIAEGDEVMHVSRLIPDFDRITGSVDVTLKGRKQPQGTQYSKGPYQATGATDEMGVKIRARQVALRVAQSGLGSSFRMGSWKARVVPDGER